MEVARLFRVVARGILN